MALYEAEVERHANLLREQGYEPPTDAEFVRFIEPDEYATVHVECLQRQGIPARATFDGGIKFGDIPDDQAQAQHEAIHRCEVMYPVHPRYSLPHTPEQIRITYDYYTETLVPCLAAEGYDVGTPPSWETFLASYGTPNQWVPYASVDAPTEQEWERINTVCPQSPPLEELYGD